MEISGPANVLDALSRSDLVVTPAAPPAPTPMTLAWLRAGVARFSRGDDHEPRRRYAQALLERADPDALRATARQLAEQILAGAEAGSGAGASSGAGAAAGVRGQGVDRVTAVARQVPVRALAEVLGWPSAEVDDVAVVARVYLTGPVEDTDVRAVDAAVARLAAAVSAGPDDLGAARVGVLVQSYEATAVLIANAAAHRAGGPPADVVAATLVDNPPAPQARRMATVDTHVDGVAVPAGETVLVNIGEAGYPFGAGPHACPGAAQARAIAEGALAALFRR